MGPTRHPELIKGFLMFGYLASKKGAIEWSGWH